MAVTRKATGWDRFKVYVGHGTSWDVVYEADLGDPTEAESKAIMDLGYWGQEITLKSIEGIKAGTPFSEVEKRAFVLRIFAPDGTHTHRHHTKAKLIEDAKRYGPPTYPQGDYGWGDDNGYKYELEGATIADVFGEKREEFLAQPTLGAPSGLKRYRVYYEIYDPLQGQPVPEYYDIVDAESPAAARAKVEVTPNVVTRVVLERDSS